MDIGNRHPTASSTFTPIDWVAWLLVVIGAVNWGLVGAFGFNLVTAIFGDMTMASLAVYVLVGLAGLYFLVYPFRIRR